MPACIVRAPAAAPMIGTRGQLLLALVLLAAGAYGILRGSRIVRAAAVIVGFLGSIGLMRAVGSIVLSGTWSQPTAEHATEQSWSIELEDLLATTLRGTVTVRGSASIKGGTFLGTREGHQVSGAITDEGGIVIADLSATIDGNLLAGTYSTPDGASGQFSATLGLQ